MPSEPFLASLVVRGGGSGLNSTLKPFEIRIVRAVRDDDAVLLPFTPQGEAGPSSPNVWFQVWEIDSFETRRHRCDSTPPSDSNDFLCELPGFILQTGRDQFEFRIAGGAPTFGSGDVLGWFTLYLKTVGDVEFPVIVPIRGEPEHEVDLACVLKDAAGNRDAATGRWAHSSCLHAHNLTHALGSMRAQGGLWVGLWAALNSENQRRQSSRWTRAHRPVTAAVLTQAESELIDGKSVRQIIKDEEFPRAAEEFARRYHSIGLHSSGDLMIGATSFSGHADLSAKIRGIVEKIATDFPAPGQPPLKIKRLAIFTHGLNDAIEESNGSWFRVGALPGFLDAIHESLTNDVLVTLFACSTGRGPRNDVEFGGLPRAGRRLGEGSFAEAFCRGLIDRGHSDAAVWAHTNAAHTTRNPNLRAFASAGAADLCWLRSEPPEDEDRRVPIATAWANDLDREAVVRVALKHPGADVARAQPRETRT